LHFPYFECLAVGGIAAGGMAEEEEEKEEEEEEGFAVLQ
jgi:hypothetical protein